MSTSGLLLEADVLLAEGRRVCVKFFVPGADGQISAAATVTRRADAGAVVRWGVRFTTLNHSARRVLRNYVGA
jgi:hypothetical protein